MKLRSSILLLALSNRITSNNALVPNSPESPQILSLTTNVCSSQGRTDKCEVELDVPASCIDTATDTSTCPVVFFFHGAGGTNDWFSRTSGVHDANVIGVYPQGEDGWNTGPKSSNICGWDDFDCTDDPDEGAFIASIITEVKALGAIGNVYLIGNSNGAALSMRLASNAGDQLPIKGMVTKVTQLLASPSRSGPGELNDNQPRAGGPPVSILNIMGTSDMVIPYIGGGSSVFGDDVDFQLMSALESMMTWSSHNGCSKSPEIIDGIVYSTISDSNGQATLYKYGGCPEGVILEHYALLGAGHSFGRGAALDEVEIDYDLAYKFITRVEAGSGGGGGGGGSPTPAPSVGSTRGCADDPDWNGKFNEAHTCEYVGENPLQRCQWENANGVLASDACEEACGECDGNETDSPTDSPDGCVDDPDWRGKFNDAHTCEYVGEEPIQRCQWEDTNGVLASDACEEACGECDGNE
mmetsp:Transcript_24637/g.51568  ORF Transcript_24637/g.51568 Transcript_24637/m.51568 type:complete len:469 (-) Transcript_24637:233-1639(-)